ncbi:MAG: hypothetical protein IJM71_08830 [Clostridia bacterium]|nr:hypothetical protein [Clostridia bacterium]
MTKEINDGVKAYSNQFSFASSGTAYIPANEIGVENVPERYISSMSLPTVKIELEAPGTLYIRATILLFDNSGNPVYIDNYHGKPALGRIDRGIPIQCEINGNKYVLPDNLKGNLRVVGAIVNISETANG